MLEDDERIGQPSTAVTNENGTRVCEVLMKDCHISIQMLAEELNMGKDSVATVFTEKMHYWEVCSRFVRHFLTLEQKQHLAEYCQNFIKVCDADSNILTSVITGDESCCFQYDPLTKRQSSAWLSLDVLRRQEVYQQKSKVKTILIIYFNAKGLIHLKYVPLNETVNVVYYVEVLKCLKRRIQCIGPVYREPGSWNLLDDNAPVQLANIVKQNIAKN